MKLATMFGVTIACCAALLAADEPPATQATTRPADDDAAVLQSVFDDLLDKNNPDAVPDWQFDSDRPVYFSNVVSEFEPSVRAVLWQNQKKNWEALTTVQTNAATEAAGDLVERFEHGDALPALKSSNGRIRIYEDAGAATQPTRENQINGETRPGHVYAPGYSKDGRYAIVRVGFPWSGRMHSGNATYLLERTTAGWKVLLHDFAYHL